MSNEKPSKLVGYSRVSSREQVEGYSLNAQDKKIREWSSSEEYTLIKMFTEPGKSAKTDKRPTFQAMINYVCHSSEIKGIVVHKSDRFARNLLDYLQYRAKLEAHGKRLFSVSEPFLNDNSPESRMVAAIIAAVAEYIADNIGRESMKGRVQKALSGSWHGSRPPIGYIRNEYKQIIMHPDWGGLIRNAFHLFSTGVYTLRQWSKEATSRGWLNHYTNKPVSLPGWNKILRNIFYLGRYKFREKEYQGDHQALIDEQTFTKVQKLLDEDKTGGAIKRHFWLLKGLLVLEDGRNLNGSKVKKKYNYYRVNEVRIEARGLEDRVIDRLQGIKGYCETAPDKLKGAMEMTKYTKTNLKDVWQLISSEKEQRQFLRLIFVPKGIIVNPGGGIVEIILKDGFYHI